MYEIILYLRILSDKNEYDIKTTNLTSLCRVDLFNISTQCFNKSGPGAPTDKFVAS